MTLLAPRDSTYRETDDHCKCMSYHKGYTWKVTSYVWCQMPITEGKLGHESTLLDGSLSQATSVFFF